MRLSSDQVSGWRRPTADERQLAVRQWQYGVNVAYMRTMTIVGLAVSAFCVLILVMPGGSDSDVGAVLGLMLFAMLSMVMFTRQKRYRRVLACLEQGEFTVLRVMAKSSFVYRRSRQYMGVIRAELPNGQEIGHLSTPYTTAKKLKREHRFPVAVMAVRIEGEPALLAFALDM